MGLPIDGGTQVAHGAYKARFHWFIDGVDVILYSDPFDLVPNYTTPDIPTLSGMGAVVLAGLLGAAGLLLFRRSRRGEEAPEPAK